MIFQQGKIGIFKYSEFLQNAVQFFNTSEFQFFKNIINVKFNCTDLKKLHLRNLALLVSVIQKMQNFHLLGRQHEAALH